MQDAQEVMGMLVKVQNEQGEMEPDDPQVSDGGREVSSVRRLARHKLEVVV